MTTDSISRFSRTVENYVRYRPTYPQAMVEFLQATCQLTNAATIADVGSGTGRVAEVFLKNGYHVFGVEPNTEMRLASQHALRNYPRFISVAATAEETTLESQSVDLITVGQAFHWFKRERARQEFARILKPQGWVVLAWNIHRRTTPFLVSYDQFWRTYLDPHLHTSDMDPQPFDDGLRAWYAPGIANFKSFDNAHAVDYEELKGRVLSSSYAPTPEQPKYNAMLEELEAVFQRHQTDGTVTIEYECRMCYGQLHTPSKI
jgi:ubiquinone/menaquinone biosynthesis C-methylase UbiE